MAFLNGVALQWKLDLRNKQILMTYYVIPLVFFGFMGGIFTSVSPDAKDTLIQAMTIFGLTMGAILGAPTPLVELYGSEIRKAYKVGGIPLWASAANNFISAFIHLFIMSVIIFFVAPVAFDAKVPENPAAYFIFLAVFLMTCLGLGTVLGVFVKSTSKLVMFSQIIFLPSIMLSGIMFPYEMLPQPLQILGKIFPATWGFKLTGESNPDLISILPLIAILVGALILSIWRISKMKEN